MSDAYSYNGDPYSNGGTPPGGFGGGLGGLGGYLNGVTRNPMFLAGLQMLGNNTPQINHIPNTMAGVPGVMMGAQAQQDRNAYLAQSRQDKFAQDSSRTGALSAALQNAGIPAAQADMYARNPQAAALALDTLNQKKQEAERQSYFNDSGVPAPATPQSGYVPPSATPTPTPAQPQYQQSQQQPQQQPDNNNAEAAALADASQKFDSFGLSVMNGGNPKTVAQVAAGLGNQTAATNFINTAKSLGLSPDTQMTGQMLTDQATALPLARAAGIGQGMPDEALQAAHDAAVQTSRDRQAARAQQQPGVPYAGTTDAGAAAADATPQQPTPQAQQAPQPAQQAQQPAPQQPTVTDRALAVREQARVDELNAKIAREERYVGSKDPQVKAAAQNRIKQYEAELAQKPVFTTIGKDAQGNEIKGFVHPSGVVTPYTLPDEFKGKAQEQDFSTFPGDTVEERLQNVPAQDRNTIRAMIQGRQAPPSSFALAKPYWQNMIQMAQRVDPLFDQTNWRGRVTEANAMSSAGRTGRAFTSMNTIVEHTARIDKLVDDLDNSNMSWLNRPVQAYKDKMGNTQFQSAQAKFLAKKDALAGELVNLVRGGVGAHADVVNWEKQLDVANSPAALHATVDEIIDTMLGRMGPLTDTHNRAFGESKTPEDFLSPKAKGELQDIRDRRLKAVQGASAQPTPAALPPGVRSIQVVQ